MRGPLALVGSGEYLPVMQATEASLIEGRAPKYVQIPTAAAQEGEESLARWIALGQAQAVRLGVEAVPVVVRDRDDAQDAELASLIDGAGLVYLSGGEPSYLAATMQDTLVWEAIVRAWENGAALAGCSAGAMALTAWAPSVADLAQDAAPGLGVLPHLWVIPHFDRMSEWEPDLLDRVLSVLPADKVLIGIDEETALVRRDERWVVEGQQQVWVIDRDGRRGYRSGDEPSGL